MSIAQKGLIFYSGGGGNVSLLSGNSAPTTEGGPGDFFLELSNSRLYGPKDPSTGWPASYIDLSGIASATSPLVFDASTQTLSLDPIGTSSISDDAVTGDKIREDEINSTHLQTNSVGSDELQADSVGSSEIAAGAVGTSELSDNAVTNGKVANSAIGYTKLDSFTQGKLVPSTRAAGQVLGTDGTNLAFVTPSVTQSQVVGLTTTLSGKADLVDGKLSTSQLPALAITSVFTAANEAAQLALTTQEGDVVVRSDENKSYLRNSGTAGTMADFTELKTPTDTVLSVSGKTGAVTLEIADVSGLQTALDGKADDVHSHAISDVTGLQTELDGKSDDGHGHVISDVTGLQTELDGKADDGHGHVISDVTGLQTELDGKADDVHSHVKADITDFDETDYAAATHSHVKADITDFDETDYAAAAHSHSISDVTNLQTELDAKQDDITRSTVTQSVTVAAGSEVSLDLEGMGKSYLLTKIESTKEMRLRLYQSAAARTADQSRPSTTPPSTQGLICEVIMDAGLVAEGLLLNPPQVGYSSANSSTTKALLKNTSATADLEVTLTVVKLEA